MSLARVPELRKTSILTVIGTVTFLMLAAFFPRSTVTLTILAILVYFIPYIFYVHLRRRRGERGVLRDTWVRDFTSKAVRDWYAAGRLTKAKYENMMQGLESKP